MERSCENIYSAASYRYNEQTMRFNRCGNSGLTLPALSLGFWWNFGAIDPLEESKRKILKSFDNGIFCFDLANNYGPPFGTAEETFGIIYDKNLKAYRQELVVTTKAGYEMWDGPNGIGSSRKMLVTSLESSLKRMRLDYVDIFYSHRYDSSTPLEETMLALYDIIRQGKAIYVGLSNYPPDILKEAIAILKELKVPCIIYQGRHNLFSRECEEDIIPLIKDLGIGYTPFSPLAKGVLTDKYIAGIPHDSRAFLGKHFMEIELSEKRMTAVKQLNEIALARRQSLAQMSISWLLAKSYVTSVIIVPRTIEQLEDLLPAVFKTEFNDDETILINSITEKS